MSLRVNVVSIFPQMFDALGFGISGRALESQALELRLTNPRDFASNRYRTVDDRPYGGGPGMVMMPAPLSAAIDAAAGETRGETRRGPVVYLSPKGRRLRQADLEAFARLGELTLIAGRYEGIDERVIQTRVDDEVSIGDYVLAGGEFAAMVVIEAIARLLPGVLGNNESAVQESFSSGLLDYPHYTRPECFEGLCVPEVLLGGDHKKIAAWRHEQALKITTERRPDLLSNKPADTTD